jgi:hypothetical protein
MINKSGSMKKLNLSIPFVTPKKLMVKVNIIIKIVLIPTS